jgi:FKBP-type peptidyl-prolyl cis-trans isomerase
MMARQCFMFIFLVIGACGFVCADLTGYYKRKSLNYWNAKAKQENVSILNSGVMIEVIKSGVNRYARSPRAKDRVKATYSCALSDGTVYDGDSFVFSPIELPHKVRLIHCYAAAPWIKYH